MSARLRVLSMLQAHAPHPVSAIALHDPSCGGIDFRARISRLRKQGHIITAEVIPGKPYKSYRYEGRKEVSASSSSS